MDVPSVASAWRTLVENLGELGVIRSPIENERAAHLLDELLEVTAADPEHPLTGLVDLVSGLIEAYEAERFGAPDASPAEVLRLLIEANDLTQADLAEEVGGQPVVSAILNGRRQINARQAAALGARFGVSPALFIAKPPVAEAARPEEKMPSIRLNAVAKQGIVLLTTVLAPKAVETGLLSGFGRASRSTDVALKAGVGSRLPSRAYRTAASTEKAGARGVTVQFSEGSTYVC
jgi:HTH-type transcriptional regulator / antitoxin HigA